MEDVIHLLNIPEETVLKTRPWWVKTLLHCGLSLPQAGPIPQQPDLGDSVIR